MILNAACACEVGRIRSKNEDNFYFFNTILEEDNMVAEELLSRECVSENNILFGVFDGMGGHACGEKAARIAAETAADSVANSVEFLPEMLENLMLQMNERVFAEAVKLKTNMGSTAAVLLLCGEKAYFCNVGDSKAFLFRNNALVQKSKDHTDKDFLEKMGMENHTPRLVQYIGMDCDEVKISPHIDEIVCAAGDQILLCSDGLTDMVSKEKMAEVLSLDIAISDKVQLLVNEAMNNGGKDNTTVMLTQIVEVHALNNERTKRKGFGGIITKLEKTLFKHRKH